MASRVARLATPTLYSTILWRKAQFVMEWLQPRLLFSGVGSVGGGSANPGIQALIVTNAMSSTAPTVATPAAAFPATVTATTTALSVLGADNNGEATLTYNWTTTGSPPAAVIFSDNGTNAAKNVTATFSRAGNYSFQVTIADQGGLSVTSSVNVVVDQTATSIVVSPGSASVTVTQQQQFAATEYDQFGQAMAQQPSLTWALTAGAGQISNSGIFTASSVVGSATVAASDGSLAGTAAVSIVSSPPTITSLSASSVSSSGTTVDISMTATDSAGSANLNYQWSVLSKPSGAITPTFSNNGANSASNTTVTFYAAGTYQLQGTVTNASGLSSSQTATIIVQQQFTSISIAPPSSMTTSSTQQLTATALDQFGAAMATQPTIAWSASGGGSISSSGLLTSSNNAGTENVTATSGSVHGQAAVIVVGSSGIIASPSTVTGTTTTLTAVGMGGGLGYNFAWSVTSRPSGAALPNFSVNNTAGTSTVVTFSHAGTYTFQIHASLLLLFQSTATITVNVSQTLTSISLSPAATSAALNSNTSFTATEFDQFGNVMSPAPSVAWAVTSGGGTMSSDGQYTAPSDATNATIMASSGNVSASAFVTVGNNAPTVQAVATASPGNPTAPGGASLHVQGADDGGSSNLTYSWSVIGTPPGLAGFSDNGTNSANSTTASVSATGTYQFLVTITDSGGLSVTSSVAVTFTADPSKSLTITTPAAQQTSENSSLTFSIAGGNAITIADGNSGQETVTLVATNGLLTLTSTTGLNFTTGTGTSNATMVFKGSQANVNAALNGLVFAPASNDYGTAGIQITASAGSNSSIADLPIQITPVALPPTVATAAAATPNPTTGTSTNLSVLGADADGESSLSYSWSVTAKPPGALNPSFSLNSSNGAKNTVATFSSAGNYTMLVTITNPGGLSVTSSVSVTVNQTLTNISVTPANHAVAVGASQQYTAVGLDQFGNNMASQPTFAWSATGGGSVNSAGLYTAPLTPASATVSAISGSVRGFTGVNVVSAGTAAASPSVVSGTTTNLSVLGGATTGVTYTWSAITTPTGAAGPTFSVNGSSSAQSTTATLFKAGNYTFQVAINNGSITTQDVNVTVNQTLTSIVVAPGSASLSENGQQQFSAVAKDQFGNSLASQPAFSWTVATGGGAIDGTGFYTAPGSGHAGAATISATVGSTSGTASINVTNAAPTIATPATSAQTPVTRTSTVLSVLGADDGGESNLTYSWNVVGTPPAAVTFSINSSNAAKDAIAKFARAGTYHFLATITDAEGLSTNSSVTVVVDQSLARLVIAPATATIFQNAQQQFSAAAFDQFGNVMVSTPAMVWSVASGGGSISGSGLYTSPGSPGVASVSVSSGFIHGSASVTVANAAPTVATPAAASATIVTGTTTHLSVLGADDAGEPNLVYTWSTTGTPPAAVIFSANGTNPSKNVTATFGAPGTYHFLATIVDAEGASVTSAVTVQVVATFSGIVVTPANSSLERAGSEQFAATAVDQFGVALASQPAFTWSTLGSVGSIDSSGFYTAPNAGIGNATIIATSGSVSGNATVSLIDDLSAIVPATQTTTPNQPLVFSAANEISITDGDAATQSVPLTLTLTVTGGTLSLSQLNGLTFSAGTGSNDSTVTFSGTVADIDSSLRGLKFTPSSGFGGTAILSVTIDEAGVSQNPPTKTVGIYVGDAASNSSPSTQAASTTQSPGSNGDNSVLTGILNQTPSSTTNWTSTPSQSSGGNSSSVFSQEPIVASETAVAGGEASAPAPAATAPNAAPANAPANPAPAAAVANAAPAAAAKTAGPAPAANHELPHATPIIPDKQVTTVPDQVFTFLAPKSEMLTNLDTMKTDMVSQKTFKVAAGSATVVSFSASAAYLVWMLRGGSLLSSLLSIFPAWKSIDPLPVLESFENSRKRRKGQADDESLESLVEKSNRNIDGDKTTKESTPETTGNEP